MAEALASAGIATRNDGAFGARMAVWADGWVDATLATTVTAALQADWDPAEAQAALPGNDRFIDGVEWFLADRGLEGRPAELARFTLLWLAGALVIAGPPEQISLAGAAAYAAGSGGNLVPAGGYGALVDRLTSGLDVRLGTAVTHVEHGSDRALVVAGDVTLEGDHAVVTVPLGVLRAGAVTFDPPLQGGHAHAVDRLAMGTEEKVVFRFSERFWPDSLWEVTHVAGDRAFPVWFDFSRHVGAPTLVTIYNPARHAAWHRCLPRVGPNEASRSFASCFDRPLTRRRRSQRIGRRMLVHSVPTVTCRSGPVSRTWAAWESPFPSGLRWRAKPPRRTATAPCRLRSGPGSVRLQSRWGGGPSASRSG
jgi:hypothetical protein